MTTLITTPSELQAINTDLTSLRVTDYELGNDIDLTGIEFTSIGDSFAFQGGFDGKYHVISGLSVPLFANVQVDTSDWSWAVIQNLTVTGNVSGAGMLAASVGSGTGIYQCSASGSVTHLWATGGLIGAITCHTYSNINVLVLNCYSNASVTSTNSGAGGLVGQATGSSLVDSASLVFRNCYSCGAVSGSTYAGGFAGYYGSYHILIDDCFWDTETSGQALDGTHQYSYANCLAYGKTTVEMQTQSTYENEDPDPWDFDTIWVMAGYPIFQWQTAPPVTTLPADQVGYAGQTARLNGSGGGGYDSNYFQYGQSATSLNRSTSPKVGTSLFSEFITALNPGITYYFRAVGRNVVEGNYEYSYGEVLNFESPGLPPVDTTPRAGYQWIESTAYHYIDSAGIERKMIGDLVV